MTERRILLVGAASRAALAWRGLNDRQCAVLARAPLPISPHERLFVVADYFAPGPDILRQADVLVNFTGITRGPDLMAVNAQGPACLARAARDAGVRQFVQISSLSVYGAATSITPESPETPQSDYGRSKLAGDRALLDVATPGFTVSLLRAPTLFGPASGKVSQLVRLLARTRLFPAPPQIKARSILHFHNLALAINQAIAGNMGGVLFAADPDMLRLDQLADLVGEITGRNVRLIRPPGAFFQLLALTLPSLHTSLYTRCVIDPAHCLLLPGAKPIRQAVAEILSSLPGAPA
jgi:UDP-glucose 4-epimerase